ncbi:MAG: FMN-binding protein [candidate division WOR-3 bacterium]|nr:MAG: FMN-binding protein [candidate division WOR-3 bacterium]
MTIWKKILLVLGVFLILIIAFCFAFFFRTQQMVKRIESIKISDVDLAQIVDGVYAGGFGDFLVDVQLEVTVKDHKIKKIEIIKQRAGPGCETIETIDRILDAQSPKVDVVTGAIGSSRSIMIAVQSALTGQKY